MIYESLLEEQMHLQEEIAKPSADFNLETYLLDIEVGNQKSKEEKEAFYRGAFYHRMCEDLMARNYTLKSEEVENNFSALQDYLYWHDISRERVNLFMAMVCDENEVIIPFDKPMERRGFLCHTIYRSGLVAGVIWAEGLSRSISPAI